MYRLVYFVTLRHHGFLETDYMDHDFFSPDDYPGHGAEGMFYTRKDTLHRFAHMQ